MEIKINYLMATSINNNIRENNQENDETIIYIGEINVDDTIDDTLFKSIEKCANEIFPDYEEFCDYKVLTKVEGEKEIFGRKSYL